MAGHVNIEIKAKFQKVNNIRSYLEKNATEFKGVDNQRDTYFKTKLGRMKLREGNIENSLILYNRPDAEGPKQSDVDLVQLNPDSGIRELLRKANGVKTVVEKRREIYFIDNVKFHLDSVKGLGAFVEIEAIDLNGDIGVVKLNEQCRYYMEVLQIGEEDLVNCSYSDMTMSKGDDFRQGLEKDFASFVESLDKYISEARLNVDSYVCDHVCLRVENDEGYESYKSLFSLIGDMLIESEVGGRLISTFKLFEPLKWRDRQIELVELPQPKPGKPYPAGFEHAEFVIEEGFESFANKYPDVSFDWKGANKPHNPELRVKLPENLSIKFHRQSLEDVIASEK